MQPPVHDRRRRRRDAVEVEDRAEPQRGQRGNPEAAKALGQVPERVGATVAVVDGVRKGTHAAGVEHHDEGTAHAPRPCTRPRGCLIQCPALATNTPRFCQPRPGHRYRSLLSASEARPPLHLRCEIRSPDPSPR